MHPLKTQLSETLAVLSGRCELKLEVGIILGTGLGALAKKIEIEAEIPYSEIPHFPLSTVESHSGKLIFGRLGGKNVVAMQGRFHYYEGYSMQEVTYPVRVLHALGIKTLLISNAAGAINLSMKKGELLLIEDHINLQPDNPLRGLNTDEFGPRFTDMSEPYDRKLNELLVSAAAEKNIKLHQGVYVSVIGPNLETRAEYRYLRQSGADAVGMSTVPEVIVANHLSLPVAAISVLTDECDPDNLEPVSVPEIIQTAMTAEVGLSELLIHFLGKL